MAFTTHGGDAPNVIPAHTAAKYIIRSETVGELGDLRKKVHRCFEAGAIATGSKLEFIGGEKPYTEMHHDMEIAAIYERNARALGRDFPDLGPMASAHGGLNRYGQRFACAALDPSRDRHQLLSGRQPSA